MKTEKDTPIRVRGQRSITSTFLFSSSKSIQSDKFEGDVKVKPLKSSTGVSLSDFLNRKLHRSGVLPSSLKGKERPMLPLGSNDNVGEANDGKYDQKKRVEADDFPLDFVLEEFKCVTNAKEDCLCLFSKEEARCSSTQNMHEAKKRKSSSSLIVIGDDKRPSHPISKQEKRGQNFTTSKKPRGFFNHYGNGGGWWDCDMEGVDNEEVGSNETWEGVGSATLGGLEWH